MRQIALRTLQSHLQSNQASTHSVHGDRNLTCHIILHFQDELLNLIHGSDVTDPVITEVIMAVCYTCILPDWRGIIMCCSDSKGTQGFGY